MLVPVQAQEKRRHYTYICVGCGAEAGSAIKPVIVAQFIDFDALLVRRLMRHLLCHHQRLGVRLGGERPIRGQVWSNLKMLLK